MLLDTRLKLKAKGTLIEKILQYIANIQYIFFTSLHG